MVDHTDIGQFEGSAATGRRDPSMGYTEPQSTSDRETLLRLAREIMGYHVFETYPENADEFHTKVPCTIWDPDAAMLIVYQGYVTEGHVAHTDPVGEKLEENPETIVERRIFGSFWNPLNEIHDAWEVLEVLQRKGLTLLLEPAVFGVDGPTASRVICMTALAAIDSKKSVLV